MPVDQAEISILIPTYRYRDKVVRAVRSALDSGAGEVIVTDDQSRDGTVETLAAFSDPRLRVFENARNLGLWENHLEALSHASRPWIKFIQADDHLLPGGLARYAAAAGPGGSMVWSAPVVIVDQTDETLHNHKLSRSHRVGARILLDACVAAGWIPGSPSHTLLRSDAIERDPTVWRTEISADLVFGAIAATKGDTVLLPHGAIAHGRHVLQDGFTQGAHKGVTRMVTTFAYLRARPEPELRRFADLYNAMSLRLGLRAATRGFLRSEGPRTAFPGLAIRLLAGPGLSGWSHIARERSRIAAAMRFRKAHRGLVDDLDLLFCATPPSDAAAVES